MTELKERARAIKADALALYRARRDPRLPWYAKALAAAVVAYALSPIDLIPDFIPVLGYVDDLLIVPLGLALAIRMVPAEVWREYRMSAATEVQGGPGGGSRVAAAVIVAVWLAAAAWLAAVIYSLAG